MRAGAVGTRSRTAQLARRWWPVLFVPAGLLLIWIARQNPALTERLFSEGLYPVMAGSIGALTSLLPFSLFEIALIILLTGAVALLIYASVHTVRACLKKGSFPRFGLFFEWLLKGLCILFFLFVITCGLNYYRPEFASFSGLTVRDSSTTELAALCAELAGRANVLREQLPEDARGVMTLEGDFQYTAWSARTAFSKLSNQYPVFPDYAITPKPVLNSWLMSQMQLTGQFTLLTFESNINKDAPAYSIPATMCHELAHTRGFMREDEANFIGYLACNGSDSLEMRYSGVMLALVYADNRLYSADRELYYQVDALLSEGVRRDFAANNAYWAQFEGPVAEVTDAVNNVYLKANNQQDGVKSYGRMVDLLLADYRQRHGLT